MSLTQANTTLKNRLFILGLIILFCLVYFKLIYADFISWDDPEYILENKDVHSNNLKALATKFYIGNYHPLTMINYAIDWKLFGGNALGYHIENLIWHFVNSILVFYVISKLVKDKGLALLITIVFTFHPIQIETIAWIAERKNLLATFFILISFLIYLKHTQNKRTFYLVITLVFFCCSLLCKPSFILFPFILLLIDWHLNQTISKQKIFQKIPFAIISILFSIITLKAQQTGGFINENHSFQIHEKIGYAGYAIGQYIYHFFNPINLSVIYPYPQNKPFGLIIGYAIIVSVIFTIYKAYRSNKTEVFFGLLFFLINILLVLQFVPFGEVLSADRYMYFALIGLSWSIFHIIKLSKKQITRISILLIIVLGSLSFLRVNVWQNSISLYKDILVKNPHSYIALNSIGAEYMKKKEFKLSEKYYNQSINENTQFYKSYYNRALLYSITNETKKAIDDYTKSIELANYYKAYIGRANIYYLIKDFPKAMSDAEIALDINDNNPKANFVLANCYDDLNQLEKALYHYNKAIAYNTEDASLYLRRGVLYGKQQQFDACLRDLEISTTLNSNYAEAYYWKGVAKVNLKQNPCSEFKKALELGFNEAQKPLTNYCR